MTSVAPGSLSPMDEDVAAPGAPEPTDTVVTGVASVDAVIDAVAAVDDQPLAEHAAVFTTAHETLRRALDDLDGLDDPAGSADASPSDPSTDPA